MINLTFEKATLRNENRCLQSIVEAGIKDSEEKEKYYKKEIESLNEIIENFNENKIYALENENKSFK